jgi:hypothetical protein
MRELVQDKMIWFFISTTGEASAFDDSLFEREVKKIFGFIEFLPHTGKELRDEIHLEGMT